MRSITHAGNRIEIRFEYTPGLVSRVKDLPDRQWDKTNKCWHVPASRFHAQQVVAWGKALQFPIDMNVSLLAQGGTTRNVGLGKSNRPGLFPFQSEGVDFLIQAEGRCLLADATGLGKTVQALTYIKEIGAIRVLVISPASVTFKWQAEIQTWVPDMTTQVIRSGRQEWQDAHVTIASYKMFTQNYSKFLSPWDVVILDECHYVSNSKTQASRAVHLLRSTHVLGLSATPFLNKPIELYNILHILRGDLFPSWWLFATRYCGLRETPFGLDVSGATNIEELSDRLRDIMLRRTKEVLGDALPPLIRAVIPLEIEDAAYRKLIKQYAKNPVNYRAAIGELRHIIGRVKIAPAIELAEDLLQDESKKVVMFCFHLDVAENIATQLGGYHPLIIEGSMSQADRTQAIDQFQTDDTHRVMIITTAGGEGINLYRASDIIFVERMWNPGKEEQLEGRLHRIGQTTSVTAHYLVLKGTLDEKFHNLIASKRKVNSSIIMDADLETIEDGHLKEWFMEEVYEVK